MEKTPPPKKKTLSYPPLPPNTTHIHTHMTHMNAQVFGFLPHKAKTGHIMMQILDRFLSSLTSLM